MSTELEAAQARADKLAARIREYEQVLMRLVAAHNTSQRALKLEDEVVAYVTSIQAREQALREVMRQYIDAKTEPQFDVALEDAETALATPSDDTALREHDEQTHREAAGMAWNLAESEIRSCDFVTAPDSFRAALREFGFACAIKAKHSGLEIDEAVNAVMRTTR